MEIQRRRPPDSREENEIITGMIVSDEFLNRIRPMYRPELFRLPWSRRVSKWCAEFHDQYHEAPRKHIEDLFHNNTAGIEPESVSAIETFLGTISDTYAKADQFNVTYRLDQAEKYFKIEALNRLREGIASALTAGQVEEAEQLAAEFVQVKRDEATGTNPLMDPEPAVAELKRRERGEGLIKLPGLLGRELGILDRGHLVAILAETNVGKSWWLQFMSLLSVYRGYNVVRFDFEMSREQQGYRIAIARTGRPDPRKLEGGILIPQFDCVDNLQGVCRLSIRQNQFNPEILNGGKLILNDTPGYKPCTACRNIPQTVFKTHVVYRRDERPAITEEDIRSRTEIFNRRSGAVGRYECREYPSGSMTVKDMRTVLKNLEYYEGFTPDVIVVDYADKVRPEIKHEGYRHDLREIWEGHKALAQEYKALVLTASQSNTVRNGKTPGKGAWAEGISKAELIDSGFSIHQEKEDKSKQIFRVKTLKLRHDDFEIDKNMIVTNCLKIGRPYIDSEWEWKPKKEAEK